MKFIIISKNRIKVSILGIILILLSLFPQFVFGQEFNIESELELGVANLQNAQFNDAFHHFEIISEVLSQSGDEEVLPVIYYLCQSSKYSCVNIAALFTYGEKAIQFTTLPFE